MNQVGILLQKKKSKDLFNKTRFSSHPKTKRERARERVNLIDNWQLLWNYVIYIREVGGRQKRIRRIFSCR